jgi:hypothetical protein
MTPGVDARMAGARCPGDSAIRMEGETDAPPPARDCKTDCGTKTTLRGLSPTKTKVQRFINRRRSLTARCTFDRFAIMSRFGITFMRPPQAMDGAYDQSHSFRTVRRINHLPKRRIIPRSQETHLPVIAHGAMRRTRWPATEMRSTEDVERYHEDQVHFERAARCGCRLRCWRRDLCLRLLLGLCQHGVGC